MSDRDRRAVLLRPGDLLLLGNVGKDVDMEMLGSLARCLKEDLDLASVVIFQEDVTLDSIGSEEIERLMDKRKPTRRKVNGPHSRACGIREHDHGSACHANCPSCGGRTDG